MGAITRFERWTCLLLLSLLLGACGSGPRARAPVEDRVGQPAAVPLPQAGLPVPRPSANPPSVQPPVAASKGLRGLENAGKPGHYTVQRGDTLVRIALDHGQNWRDLARWNGLDNPNLIEVGEVLRVTAPNDTPPARPGLPAPAEQPARPPSAAAVPVAPVAPAAQASSAPAPAIGPAAASEELSWIWPAQGQTVTLFDEVKNKGVDIAARAGDPVLAAADGRVVYAGAGLRGYGNLIIVKHNNTYLTAYAHNQALLVKEDQMVRQGQKIAEMGSSDADRVKLHFEIRRQGKPVDPLRYLPPR
jgi:lipoprotein NlpD